MDDEKGNCGEGVPVIYLTIIISTRTSKINVMQPVSRKCSRQVLHYN